MTIQVLDTDYAGKKSNLFWLALKTSILTVLTVGFYRFWMKTRLRRYYWSAIRPGGVPLEYTGTGMEKLMGFLIAVVFLAFYIGVFNLILMFLSFSLLNDNFAAYFMSFVGLIPIYFFAKYRARRYVLARTRWRGLRFGIDPGACGYSWRAMIHWALTLLTFGFLLPRQMFWLEKYRTDRTWFGQDRFFQDGKWSMLLKPAVHFYIGIVLCLVSGIGGAINPAVFSLLVIAVPWLLVGWIHLQVAGFKVMASHKRLGDNVTFRASPRSASIVGIYLLGGFLAYLVLVAVIIVAAIVAFTFLAVVDPTLFDGDNFDMVFSNGGPRQSVVIAAGALAYFSVFIFWGVLLQVFITLPIMRHYAQTLSILDSHNLAFVTQRSRDEFTEAEGFADALDIGAAL